MNKPLELTIYLDSMEIGSLVLKAPKQYYKISGLLDVLPLAAEVAQFIRSVVAGATPHSLFTLADLNGRKYELELRFAQERVHLVLMRKVEHTARIGVFEWEGGFGDFKDGFKTF